MSRYSQCFPGFVNNVIVVGEKSSHSAHEAATSVLRHDSRRGQKRLHKRGGYQLRSAVGRSAFTCLSPLECCIAVQFTVKVLLRSPMVLSVAKLCMQLLRLVCNALIVLKGISRQRRSCHRRPMPLGSPHLGTATIPVSELLTGEVVTGWQNLEA